MSSVNPVVQSAPVALDIAAIRREFPVLDQQVNGHPLVYLDNGASAQKPNAVIEAEAQCYREYYANIHRGVHSLSQRSTSAFEAVRGKVRQLLNAPSEKEVIFTRGTTEGINLVAYSFVEPRLQPGDEILITAMEHHSNIVPWQILCERTGAKLVVVPISDAGEISLEDVEARLSERTRIVSIIHVSNALGTINPVKQVVDLAHARDIPVLVDGAQSAPHMPVDVQALGCDFFVFSGHKLYGPSGVGVLWGRYDLLKAMRPWQGGGDMIRSVTFEKTEFADPPARFEAGTPNIAGVIGLGAAVDWFMALDPAAVAAHEADLLAYATEQVGGIAGVRLIGTAHERAGALSFVMEDAHPHDIGTILDGYGVAVRAGHHCAEPVMRRYGVPATARASFGVYNTREEVDRLVMAIGKVRELFGPR
ncbi:cysteine desulfurase/selenocysteine lyase [Natronocella acetinitrilica]|uniref:Cysteine desulfurase n=1 Tax=Natronocella acetinitrilica TaxID=414046 RepID=A0AAE3G352_9GAMM|nr:cysteine desulfurase [Natronocella acetinitrilica]MCP1674941.1 cysteine desulfurase/selenocysteine lyase [Natronocella acetinitrilica]